MAAMRTLSTIAALTCLLTASPGFAQEAAPRPGADEYTQRVQAGIQLLTSGDTNGAMAAFREAVQLDGARPMAPYYLAAANRMSGHMDEALTGFRRAAELAQSATQPRWQGRALQAIADTLERIGGRLEETRNAWQEYVRFADANQAVTFPQLGRARVQAVNIVTEQEAAYVAVRERIAAREREHAEEQRTEGSARPRRR
jgi:tetratricopeptide (TPR) repeat protein